MFQNIKYKKTHILFTVIQVLLIAMLAGWYYFSERKMGMVRHILFRNVYRFPNYFTDLNLKLLIFVLVILVLVQLFLVIKAKKFIVTFVINGILVLISAYIILIYDADKLFIYYYVVIFCGLFNLARFFQFLTLKTEQ